MIRITLAKKAQTESHQSEQCKDDSLHRFQNVAADRLQPLHLVKHLDGVSMAQRRGDVDTARIRVAEIPGAHPYTECDHVASCSIRLEKMGWNREDSRLNADRCWSGPDEATTRAAQQSSVEEHLIGAVHSGRSSQ